MISSLTISQRLEIVVIIVVMHGTASPKETSISIAEADTGGARAVHTDGLTPNMTPKTLGLVVHSFVSFVICNIDRINLSVAIIPMAQLYGWNSSRQGLIQSIFFAGYMMTNILGGKLADRHGGRKVLAGGVLFWSFFTGVTPFVAPNFFILLAVRVCLGAGEGVAMPAMNAMIACSVPSAFRARAVAFIYSGMYVGSILGLVITPFLLEVFDFRAAFYIYAVAGFIWVVLFLLTTEDPKPSSDFSPIRSSQSSQSDCAEETSSSRLVMNSLATEESPSFEPLLLSSDGSAKENEHLSKDNDPPLSELMSHRAVWAIIVAHFCCTWGYFVLIAWLPTYLHSRFNLNIRSSALLSTLPWFFMFIFANVGGLIADHLLSRGIVVTRVRKIIQAIGFLGPAISLFILIHVNTLGIALTCIASAVATSAFSQSGVYANHQDIGPKIAGTLLGISNTFASIPGLVGVWITGVILDLTDNHWGPAFALACFFYGLGFVVYSTMATADRIW